MVRQRVLCQKLLEMLRARLEPGEINGPDRRPNGLSVGQRLGCGEGLHREQNLYTLFRSGSLASGGGAPGRW